MAMVSLELASRFVGLTAENIPSNPLSGLCKPDDTTQAITSPAPPQSLSLYRMMGAAQLPAATAHPMAGDTQPLRTPPTRRPPPGAGPAGNRGGGNAHPWRSAQHTSPPSPACPSGTASPRTLTGVPPRASRAGPCRASPLRARVCPVLHIQWAPSMNGHTLVMAWKHREEARSPTAGALGPGAHSRQLHHGFHYLPCEEQVACARVARDSSHPPLWRPSRPWCVVRSVHHPRPRSALVTRSGLTQRASLVFRSCSCCCATRPCTRTPTTRRPRWCAVPARGASCIAPHRGAPMAHMCRVSRGNPQMRIAANMGGVNLIVVSGADAAIAAAAAPTFGTVRSTSVWAR